MREIISLLPYFASILISVSFYNFDYIKIHKQKISLNYINILVIFCTVLSIFINNSLNILYIKYILCALSMSIMSKIIYKDNWKVVFTTYIFIFIGLVIIEIPISNIYYKIGILNNYNDILSSTSIKIMISGTIEFVMFLIISIPIINRIIRKLIHFFESNINSMNIMYLIYLSWFILSILNAENFINAKSIKLIFILALIFFVLFVITMHSKYQENTLRITNKKLIDYNDKYGKFLDEYKIYKHNIKHKLSAMKAYGNKRINALIDDLLEEETTFSVKNNNLYSVPNGIKGIVAEKLYNANIDVLIDNKIKDDPFKKLSPKAFNALSESLGIVLDNAIEATEETENPIVVVDLYENEEDIFIKVGNNFCNSIDIDDIGTKYYSTKNRGSGLGLFSIVRNNLVKEKINIINDFYYIELQIKKAR